MTGNIVARRYARALFSLGKKSGTESLKAFGAELASLAKAIEDAPELEKIFRNPIFSTDEKRKVLSKIMEKVKTGAVVSNFCNLLADKDRLSLIPEIRAYYDVQLDAEEGIIRGEFISAVKLNKAKREAVKAQLEAQAAQKLVLDFSTDKTILGGVVLKIGDKVLDASLRAQLDILKENIKRGE